MHALIIDDNQNNIDVLEMLLANEGWDYSSFRLPRDLQRALDQSAQNFDIVFLDIEFPNDDGFKMLNPLKAHPRLENVPIVAYSVHISEIDRARDAGFAGFIGKPLNAQRFPQQLQRIVQGRAVWEV